MLGMQSNRDALLLVIPMLIGLFAFFFRLDELWCLSRKKPRCGRRLTNWDKNGIPMCKDPELNDLTIARRQH